MVSFTLTSKFKFGKHKGDTLQNVLLNDSAYISWCLMFIHEFFISDEVLKEIKAISPDFELFAYAELARKLKKEERYFHTGYERYIWADLAIHKALENS